MTIQTLLSVTDQLEAKLLKVIIATDFPNERNGDPVLESKHGICDLLCHRLPVWPRESRLVSLCPFYGWGPEAKNTCLPHRGTMKLNTLKIVRC